MLITLELSRSRLKMGCRSLSWEGNSVEKKVGRKREAFPEYLESNARAGVPKLETIIRPIWPFL